MTAVEQAAAVLAAHEERAHANPSEDFKSLGLYGEAYRECVRDIRAALEADAGVQSPTSETCRCLPDECLEPGYPGCYFDPAPTTATEADEDGAT